MELLVEFAFPSFTLPKSVLQLPENFILANARKALFGLVQSNGNVLSTTAQCMVALGFLCAVLVPPMLPIHIHTLPCHLVLTVDQGRGSICTIPQIEVTLYSIFQSP